MRDGDLLDGRYRLVAPLGRGGMGQVFRATDERLRRDVAIKVVDLTQTTDATIPERFNREAIATARLNHPAIVTIFDTGSDSRVAWLVMELLRGRTLAQVLREDGPLPQPEAVRIGHRVAQALVATHAIGVVHRDIKPANVMVDGESVKLLDFGIAQVTLDAEAHLTAPATTIGTAAYMSPEQARGWGATAASDVYALGGVLVAMLTGQPAFPGENALEVANRHLEEAPPRVRDRRPDVLPSLDDLITRMLAKDPSARPPATLVVQALEQIQNNPDAAPTSVLPSVPPLAAGAVGAAGAAGLAAAARDASAATAVQPPVGTTRVQPQATAVQPPAGATRVQSHATAVLPPNAEPPQGPPPPSAVRWQAAPDDGGSVNGPDPQRYKKAAGWIGLLVVAILVFMVTWALGSALVPRGAATPTARPTTSATTSKPTATPTRTRTPTPRPTPSTPPISLPTSLPSVSVPTIPSGQQAATAAAAAGVDLALNSLASGASGDEADALAALQDDWGSTKDDVIAGKKPVQALGKFNDRVDRQVERGNLQSWQAEAIKAAVGAVEATL